MSTRQLSGIPQNLNLQVTTEGICVRFKQWTSSIILRADSPCLLYWTKEDFDADQNSLLFPGEQPTSEFRVNASVANIWLRGQGSNSNVAITYIGRDGF
jgi:hypothetical protein